MSDRSTERERNEGYYHPGTSRSSNHAHAPEAVSLSCFPDRNLLSDRHQSPQGQGEDSEETMRRNVEKFLSAHIIPVSMAILALFV